MSANTLNNRSIGQTILDTFFNDIHSALDGDFVGRGASGIPTSGQNLGTLALPWGALYCTTLNLGGSALDTSKIVSPANRIISGKIRATSNQPAFITPNGGALSFILAGASTNLLVSIAGASVTVNTDITKSGLTAAPSSNNTCVVNDATASAQADTRQWGEYWSNKIIVGTVGSNITALVGTFASFKVVHSGVTEYFTAFVESSTLLSHAYRGYFYDSSLNPINRVLLSNSDTITLMKQGFVFITNDATTVDVCYTVPTWSATSPTSPATGDYWFDLVNLIWKRYDGASWAIINRTLVGMVIMDATNCVAARSFDFYANYQGLNSIDLEIASTTVVRAKRQRQQISVAGKIIDFGSTLPTWNGTTNYASSSTDYYATLAISTNYYLYIKDDGTCVVSDIQPYYRPDLHGMYHPHNPWRSVGMTPTDGSSNFVQTQVGSGPVVGATKNRAQIRMNTHAGFGGTDTSIPYFTNVTEQYGSAFTVLTNNSTNGLKIRINEDGIYSFSFANDGNSSAAQSYAGLSLNSTQLTTSIIGITAADRLICCGVSLSSSGNYGNPIGCSWTGFLKSGDIVRPHTDASVPNTSAHSSFSACKVSD